MGGGMKAVLDVYGNGEREQSCVGAPPCYDSEHGRDGKGKHFKENKECLVTDWRAEQEGVYSCGSRKVGGLASCRLPGCLMAKSFQGSPFYRSRFRPESKWGISRPQLCALQGCSLVLQPHAGRGGRAQSLGQRSSETSNRDSVATVRGSEVGDRKGFEGSHFNEGEERNSSDNERGMGQKKTVSKSEGVGEAES